MCRVNYDRVFCLGNMVMGIEGKSLLLAGHISDVLGWPSTPLKNRTSNSERSSAALINATMDGLHPRYVLPFLAFCASQS